MGIISKIKMPNESTARELVDSGAIRYTEKGSANGIAELNSEGKVPSSQLPSYVDDVLEYPSLNNFPATGESGKIYIAIDTNKSYRWSGSTYVEISPSIALGETSSTAYRGDRGKAAYDHSQTAKVHVPSHTGVDNGKFLMVENGTAVWGNDGITTSVTVNGETFTQSDGNINLGTLLRQHQSLAAYRTSSAQDEIDAAIAGRVGAIEGKESGWDAKYNKPQSGIPKTDLASAVQTSLSKADTALQSHQDISGKENSSNKVTSWSSTTTDAHYPSEKLVKTALDGKASSSHTHDDRYYTESEIDTKLSGKSNTSHTHTKSEITDFPTSMPASDVSSWAKSSTKPTYTFGEISSRGEAFLSWGGNNFSGSYGPIDASMVPELGANRLAFMPYEAITIEYSTDGGSTWADYGASNDNKIGLFNGNGVSLTIGKASTASPATANSQLRVTINTGSANVYTALNKFCIYVSTSGSSGCWCTIRGRLESNRTAGVDTWSTFASKVPVSGWSGYNIINTTSITTYGNAASSQYGQIQFIFGATGAASSYAGLSIQKIFGFGGVGWTTPSTMAKNGNMYTYDNSKNVTFPAGLKANSFTENGTALTDKYAAKTHTHDDRYYTESEINTKLSGKSDTSHTHNYAASSTPGGGATSVEYSTGTADQARHVWFSNTDGIGKMVYDDDFKYNPATNVLTVGSITGNAATATNSSKVNGHTVNADVPSNAEFTDTKYSSKSAVSGGVDVSLVTTGEKYTWNNKGTYSKPSSGIPKTDLASAVQTSLSKADTALQSHQDISGKENISNKVTSISSSSTDTQYPTAKAVYNAIDALPEPMVFKGSLGTGGTTTSLPTASSSNNGHTYKVITAGTYASQSAKVGDTFICNGSSWVLIPSGDEPSGTVTSVAVKMNGATKGTVTTSGTIDLGTVITAHQDISGKENSSNKVTSWSSTTTDAHYPSEKLVKTALDGKASSSHTHTKSQITDFPIPSYTSADNGKFLMVENGAAVWADVPSYTGGAY